MSEYSSYFLYQKYEKRGDQDWIPAYPNVYSIDGDGTMPLVMKKEYDQQCGYTGGCDPRYDWVEIPIDEDYECDDCDINIQTRWVDYTDAFTYFGDYKYGIQILETKVEDGEWTRQNQTKYTTNPIGKAARKMIVGTLDDIEYSTRCGTSDGRYYNYPSTMDEWFYQETTDNSGLFENYKLCNKPDLFELETDTYSCGRIGQYCGRDEPNDWVLRPTEYGQTITSVTFGDCVIEIGNTNYCTGFSYRNNPDAKVGIMFYPNVKSVTLSDTLEKLGTGIFSGNTGLTSITFPDTLKNLGAEEPAVLPCDGFNGLYQNDCGTFEGCGLISVNTNQIEQIGRRAFADNLHLTKITIGSACTRLDEAVFNNCPTLRQIIFEGTTVPTCHKHYAVGNPVSSDVTWKLTDTDEYYGHNPEYLPPECKIYVPCDALTTFKNSPLTSGYTDIIYGYGGECGDMPFIPTDYKIKTITYLDNGVPITVNNVLLDDDGTGQFTSADTVSLYTMFNESGYNVGPLRITNIEFGDCIRNIANNALSNYSLSRYVNYVSGLTLNNGVVSIGSNAFQGFMNTELVIPNSVTSLGNWAFCQSSGGNPGVLRSLTIGTGITSIPQGCFYRTIEFMTSLSIPNNITSIATDAFFGCNNLSQLHIGSGITSIASDAFYQGYNTGFTNITIERLTPPTIAFSTSYSCFTSRSQINVHCSAGDAYVAAYKTNGNYKGTIKSIEPDCTGSTKTRWVESGTTCVGVDKYNQVAQQVSNDWGQTWSGNGITSATTLIEANSTDCGYVPENWSFKVTYEDASTRYSEYTGSTLTSGQTRTLLSGHQNAQAEIGTGITSLSTNCIYGMGGMVSLTIPNNVVSLGQNSLLNCSGLTSLVIPDSVTSIGKNAVVGCSSLTALTVGSGVTSVATGSSRSIYGLTSLVHLTWNAPVSFQDTFQYSKYLATVEIGDRVASIERQAFNGCSALTSVTIGSGVRTIDISAFSNCTSLRSITIPSGVTSINSSAFRYCYMPISNFVNNSSLDEVAAGYWGCAAYDTDADGVLLRDGKVLMYVGNGTNAIIPDSATSIDNYAFQYCSGLTSCTIGSGITRIGSYAFYYCSGLTSVVIPSAVSRISYMAFYGCESLESITCLATTPPTMESSDVFTLTNNCPIYVPSGSVSAYKADYYWKNYKSRIQAIPS